HVGSTGVRIFVNDRLKLFLSGLRAISRRSEGRKVRLFRSTGSTQLCVHCANGLGEIEAGFLVLCAEIIPSTNHCGEKDGDCDCGNDEGSAMRDRPIGGSFGGVYRYTA